MSAFRWNFGIAFGPRIAWALPGEDPRDNSDGWRRVIGRLYVMSRNWGLASTYGHAPWWLAPFAPHTTGDSE